MASTLIHIKSRTLLPRPDPTQEDGEAEEDPREALMRRLLEHQKFWRQQGCFTTARRFAGRSSPARTPVCPRLPAIHTSRSSR